MNREHPLLGSSMARQCEPEARPNSSTNLFAIVVPIGSWTPRIRYTLSSLARQEIRPAVAIFDASGDERVRALVDEFSNLVTYRHHGPDGGQAEAIARGWDTVPGEIIGWLNADDYLAPGALETVKRAFDRSLADVVYGQSLILDHNDTILGLHPAVEPPSDHIRSSCIVSQPSCFVRRAAVNGIGGLDKRLAYTMDWDLWVRLWDAGAEFVYVSDVLSAVVWERGTKTSGLRYTRLREIREIVARTGDQGRTLRTIMGFTLHHLATYSRLRAIFLALIHLRRRLRRSVSGAQARRLNPIDLFHERGAATTRIIARARRGVPLAVAVKNEAGEEIARASGIGCIALRAFLAPGQRMILDVEPPLQADGELTIELES